MEVGQSSGSNSTAEIWAKLVPSDSNYNSIEISSSDTSICSHVSSTLDELKWCQILRNPNLCSATISNKRKEGILVDGALIQSEEKAGIKCGSEIVPASVREGHLSYKFEVMAVREEQSENKIKILVDSEHTKCSICLNVWHDVVTVAPCLHNFCNGCFSEWLRRCQEKHSSVLCPHCRGVVYFVGRNHFLHNIEEDILQADASINETIRISFREAGAVQRLVYLLSHNSDALQLPVLNALEKLSVSNHLCEAMEMEDVTQTLVDILKDSKTSGALMEKTLSILARIWDPNKQMKFTFYERPVNGSRESTGSGNRNAASLSGGKMADVKHMLDSALVARLATMLNTGSSIFQAKIASILEFITMVEPCIDTVVATHLESGLLAVFQQNLPKDMEEDVEKEPDPAFLEEAGLAISSASRLLTKLIDLPQFHNTINSDNFTKLLRQILKSDIPLHHKDWVAGCLVRLSLFSSPIESSITTEITLYETIPRLIEQIKTSSTNRQEDAVVQLNRIISEGVEGASQAIVSHGGVFPLVKVIEEGNDRGVEAGIAILYNLSMDSENHSAILSAGVVPVLTRMVRSETSHYMRALRLLRNLPV